MSDTSRLNVLNEDPLDLLSVLQLGNMDDIAETPVLLGCITNTANHFRSDKKKHSHLFPGNIPPSPSSFPPEFEKPGSGTKTHRSCLRARRHDREDAAHPRQLLPHAAKSYAVPLGQEILLSAKAFMKEFSKALLNDDLVQTTSQVSALANLAEKVMAQLKSDPVDYKIPLLSGPCTEHSTSATSTSTTRYRAS